MKKTPVTSGSFAAMKLYRICVIAVLLIFYSVEASLVCTNVTTNSTRRQSDFLFLIDNSGSMGDKINGVISGLKTFVASLTTAGLDARYAVVTFGGTPILRLPFTNDSNAFYTAMTAIRTDGGGQEASFEAMRMALTNNGASMTKACAAGVQCSLVWRTTATKIFIHATDEDSDLPTDSTYRMPGQTVDSAFCTTSFWPGYCQGNLFEPAYNAVLWNDGQHGGALQYYRNESTFRLASPYVDEISATAALLISQGVYVNSLVSYQTGAGSWNDLPVQSFDYGGRYGNLLYQSRLLNGERLTPDDMTAAIYQFGSPNLTFQNADFSGFDSAKTATNLQQAGLQNSLQNRLLAAGSFMRVFDIASFVSSDQSVSNSIISAFYSQIVQTTRNINQQCVSVPDPTVTVSSFPSSKTSSSTSSSTASSSSSTTSSSATSNSSTSTATASSYSSSSTSTSTSAASSSSMTSAITSTTSSASVSTSSTDSITSTGSTETSATTSSSVESAGPTQPAALSVTATPSQDRMVGVPPSELQQTPAIAPQAAAGLGVAGFALCAGALAMGLFIRRRNSHAALRSFGSSGEVFAGTLAMNPLFHAQTTIVDNKLYENAASTASLI